MKAGRLRFRLTLTNPVYPDVPTSPNPEPTYTRIDTFAADIVDLGEQEKAFANQQGATVTHRVTARWNEVTAQITTASRLVLGVKTFHVTRATNTDGRNREIVLEVAEKVS